MTVTEQFIEIGKREGEQEATTKDFAMKTVSISRSEIEELADVAFSKQS